MSTSLLLPLRKLTTILQYRLIPSQYSKFFKMPFTAVPYFEPGLGAVLLPCISFGWDLSLDSFKSRALPSLFFF